MTDQILIPRTYVLHKQGGINLSLDACKDLGWKPGRWAVDQHINIKDSKLLIVPKDAGAFGLPDEEYRKYQPLWKPFSISKNGYMTITSDTKKHLGWLDSDKFKQTIDKEVGGIIITKSEEQEDGNN